MLEEIIRLGCGIALQEQTLMDVISIVEANGYEPDFLGRIKNQELLVRLYDFYRLAPDEPIAFLRYLVFKITGSSLLIKNKELIRKIKACPPDKRKTLDELIQRAPNELATIFLRFKPIPYVAGPFQPLLAYIVCIFAGVAMPYLGHRSIQAGGKAAMESVIRSAFFIAVVFVVSDHNEFQEFLIAGSEVRIKASHNLSFYLYEHCHLL